ncbi:MAG: GAF domain-containing protein [Anaerolineae bacterium]|jgi:PAS domain S-box-containing protein
MSSAEPNHSVRPNDPAAETARLSREILALQAVGAAITSRHDVQRVLRTVAGELANLLDMEACLISRCDPQGANLRLLASHLPAGDLGDKLAVDETDRGRLPTTQHVLREKRALHVTPRHADLAPADQAYVQRLGARTWVKLPMLYQDQVMGLVEMVDSRQEHPSPIPGMPLAQLLANQAASVIENTRLYEALQRRVAEVTTLNRIGQVITSILDLDKALSIIADHALWLLDVELTAVILYDQDRGQMWLGAASGRSADWFRHRTLALGRGIAGWVISHGEPLIVPDVAQDPRFDEPPGDASGFAPRSSLCVPLRARGQIIGAIETLNKYRGSFDQEDLTLLRSMAASAAIAIENARLYQQAQDHASGLEALVTERTRELRAERDRTQAILEAVGEAVIVTNLDGEIQYLNPAAVELTGYPSEETLGRTSFQWPHQAQESAIPVDTAEDAPSPPGTKRANVVSRRKDGSLYDAAMTVAPLFDSEQPERLIGYVSVQRDITPIMEAERLKDQFVSNVSHELRTPLSILTLVSGNLDRLYDRLDDAQRQKMIHDIRDQAGVLTDLIGDVLEISRIESGRVSMERQRVDLMHLVAEETEKQLPLAQKKAQRISVVGQGTVEVWGNPDQLRQVIRNLLNNAIKYTPDEGQISCECRVVEAGSRPGAGWPGSADLPGGSWAALRVVDTGPGISPEDLPHLFERFYRVKNQSNIPGTGLGLSITQELVELHQGRVAVASTLDQGSTFAAYLPLLEE